MIAALPMYDRPETRAATDRLWGCIRDALRARGIDAPDRLTRDRDPWELWQSPDLILAQTCGLPFRARLAQQVTLVATPDYALPGCPPGQYNSVVLGKLPDGPAHPAVNEGLSQSGWAALTEWATSQGVKLGAPLMTGSHAASAQAVAEGRADIAAIDAQTHRLLCRHTDWAGAIPEIGRSRPTPGLPLITARGRDPAPIRAALADALAALPFEESGALDLHGFVTIPASAYLALPIPAPPA